MSKRSRNNTESTLQGFNFVIGSCYKGKRRKEIKTTIEQNGGTVATTPAMDVSFLIQAWADDPCDDHLEECCDFGIVAVPFEYVQHCVEHKGMTPFRTWAQLGERNSTFCNPISSTISSFCVPVAEAGIKKKFSCLLGVLDMGNMDTRCRESEEINQSVYEHNLQKWPALGDEGRDTIYIQPFITLKEASVDAISNSSPGSVCRGNQGLLTASSEFLSAYFGCTVNILNPLQISNPSTKKGRGKHHTVEAAGLRVRVCESDQVSCSGGGSSNLLNVLDMLDVVQAQLPEDGYCILGITDEYIYEWDGEDGDELAYPHPEDESLHGLLRGRAFGGSRIAVFSSACYGEALRQKRGKSSRDISSEFAYQLSTMAHEAMHCFGLDHCGLYTCCMNSWCDEIQEFARPPRPNRKQLKFEGGVVGCLHVCPVCVRKLQITCGFDLEDRYFRLKSVYESLGLQEQAQWCAAIIRIGRSRSPAES